MTGRSIYWHDGMFMWPQHMQLEERFRAGELAAQNRANVPYFWGLRTIDIDLEALATNNLVVRGLEARMRDGALIVAPDSCVLPALDVREGWEQRDRLMIYLAIPKLNADQANVPPASDDVENSDGGTPLKTRYRIAHADVADENTGSAAVSLEVRRINARLLTETQDHAGYEVLEIMRLERVPDNPAQVQLDVTYIPPLLACDGWPHLSQKILQDLHHRFGLRMELLAELIRSRGISFETHSRGDQIRLGQLSACNEAYAVLNTLAFAQGVHPFQAYLELARIVGQLAVFSQGRRLPALPPYDHDNLGFCFYRAVHQIDGIEIEDSKLIQRQFIGEELRMQVKLESVWLEPTWQMFVGVQSSLPSAEVVRLLGKAKLDMKIGSAERVDELFRRGFGGLEVKPAAQVPADLPTTPGMTYFQVNRDSNPAEWKNLKESLKLAIRVNETLVETDMKDSKKSLQSKKELTLIKSGGTAGTMLFHVFLVPQHR